MSETVFTKVDYDLGTLVKFIALGEIGLSDFLGFLSKYVE